MDEKEVLAKYSTPGLQRGELTRSSKKHLMEFDATFNTMTKQERDDFLDKMFPNEPASPPPDPSVARPENTDPSS